METERSFVMVKPDGVKKGLTEEVISRLENAGLTIVEKKELLPTKDLVLQHYADDNTWYESVGAKTIGSYKKAGLDITKVFGEEDPIVVGKTVRQWLVDYITSGPVMAMIVEGPAGMIKKIREIAGNTNPIEAEPGTLRGDYSDDSYEKANNEARSVQNIIHASESPAEAEREIKLWFGEE